jgi:hypothetical protein
MLRVFLVVVAIVVVASAAVFVLGVVPSGSAGTPIVQLTPSPT